MAEAELRIPVFTVLKSGAVLKNIFIVNRSPPLDQDDDREGGEGGRGEDEEEEVLTVGRHSNCSIVLTHPSVSRFHLQIYSNPSSRKLSVMDLSSVHGTWISDKKIEPGEKVELAEGDTLRVGASSRVYRLHWIPLSQAYDLEQSFVSAPDVSFSEDKYEDSSAAVEGDVLEAYQVSDTPESECEELEEFDDPSYKREEDAPFGEGEVVEVSADDGLPKVSQYEEVEEFIDPLGEVEKTNLMIGKGESVEAFQDEELLDIENEAFVKFEDPFSGEEKMDIYQKQDMPREDQEIHSPDLISGEMRSFTFNEASELLAKCEISTVPTVLEDIDSSMLEEDKEWQSPSENDSNQVCDCSAYQLVDTNTLSSLCLPMEDQSQTDNWKSGDEKVGTERLESEVSEIFPISECSGTVESRYSSGKPNEETESLSTFSALCLLESPPLSSKLILAQKGSPQDMVQENLMLQQLLYSEPDLPSSNEKLQGYGTRNCEGIDQIRKEDILSLDLVKPAMKPLNSSFSEQNILSEVSCRYVNRENQPASSPLGRERQSDEENLQSPPIKSLTKSNQCSLWSRRGKPFTALQLQTGSSRGTSRSTALNSENVQNCKENVEDELITRNLFADSDGEEEIFTPDKENMTPNTRKLKFLKEVGKAGVLHSRPLKGSSSKLAFSPKICPIEDSFQSSDKENQTPKREVFTRKTVSHQSGKANKVLCSPNSYPDEDALHSSDKENRTPKFQRQHIRVKSSSRTRSRLVKEISGAKEKERMPFQSLHLNSDMESHSSGPGALMSSSSVEFAGAMEKKKNYSVRERKNSWIMVADSTCFLDKDSRKALQLLEGLRGTQLVIPRMVLRELDTLKRQCSLFRRRTDICSVLEWIEETMIASNWWIHVQSSAEEGWAVAPTPRASPYSFSEASDNFSFSGNSSVEIASPTAEDRILEYALQVRKMNSAARLVLLSDDISMKIKAMAEGLLCEAPKEFRESLVNPFSERFMWAGSSPRGQTWSLSDDAVLRENNFLYPSTRPSRGDCAKGLKLILRHNSHYGQMKSLS